MTKKIQAELFFSDLADQAAEVLIETAEIPHDQAGMLALEIIECVCSRWAKRERLVSYFPRDTVGKTERLHLQIYNDFTGDNHDELVRKYKKSFAMIYRVIRETNERLMDQKQGKLL